jgi:hypothetical protein
LKLLGVSSIQPHFHFIVSNERSYFKEQESSALPTELTTHFIDSNGEIGKQISPNWIIAILKFIVQKEFSCERRETNDRKTEN